jgi:23S rRNA (cytidine1920-2'-O)/16S rRNA (cytidine1409-2'-O)-methyltransferase
VKGIRADILVVEQQLAESRTRAQALILAGLILREVDDHLIHKPGELLAPGTRLRKKAELHPYVSRGGVKLKAALDAFGIGVRGYRALDVGASTGGFTDCLLQEGASQVYTVDVGQAQLAWRLRCDPRIQVAERQDIRRFHMPALLQQLDLVVIDVSFIGLTHVLPAALAYLRPQGHLVALIKPQFEAGRTEVSKGGIVRDEQVRQSCVQRIEKWISTHGGQTCRTITSPILGQKGNEEYLITAIWPQGYTVGADALICSA